MEVPMNDMKEFFSITFKFLNYYNGFFMLISTIVLVGVTIYYAMQTKFQVNKASEAIAESKKQFKNLEEKDENIMSNYMCLLNNEIVMNLYHYLFFLSYFDPSVICKAPELILKTKEEKEMVKSSLFSNISDSSWHLLNSEAAKYFPNELMIDLAGCYSGVAHLKIYKNESNDKEGILRYINLQVYSTLRCIHLLNKFAKCKLRNDNKIYMRCFMVLLDYEKESISWTKIPT
jgi:hypothetical protein